MKRANLLSLLIFPVLALGLALPGCSDSKLPEVIEAVNDGSSASGGLRKASFEGSTIPSVTETVEDGRSLNLRTVLSSGHKGGLEIPAGSLSVGSEVTLEEAMTIVYDQEVTALLDLKENAKVLTASDAVLVSSSASEKAKNAMVLMLPVPAFELKVANNPFENLVVIARVFDPSDHGLVKLKVINPDQISLTSNGVEIEIFDFGAYQASIISVKPSEGNKVVVSVSDIENRKKREIVSNILNTEELIADSIADPDTIKGQNHVREKVENSGTAHPKQKIEISGDTFNQIIKEVIQNSSSANRKVGAQVGEVVDSENGISKGQQALEEIKQQIDAAREATQKQEERDAINDQKEALKVTLAQLNDTLIALNGEHQTIKLKFGALQRDITLANYLIGKNKNVNVADLTAKVDEANALNLRLLDLEKEITSIASEMAQCQDRIDELNEDFKNLQLLRITALGGSIDTLNLRRFRAFSDPDKKSVVRLIMVLPLDPFLYSEVVLRKISGWDPPQSDCASDGEVVGIWNKADIQDGGALVTDDLITEHASYRACVFDEAKNLIHTQSEDSYLSLSFVLQ